MTKAGELNWEELFKGYSPEDPTHPHLEGLKEKTHTVEVHPDMDMYHRAKGLIKENNRDHLQLIDFKRAGFPKDIIKKMPRDAKGRVTPELLDDHIKKLPKQKVNINIADYDMGAQQHREGPQYVAQVHLHPDAEKNMPKHVKDHWDSIKYDQHFPGQRDTDDSSQLGWARIDPFKNEDGKFVPHNHWHIDEIQSDFQNKDKLKRKDKGADDKHNSPDQLLTHLSHGHNDPQHLIHSALNEFARKQGIKSTSMDMPQDQAKQSSLLRNQDGSEYEIIAENHAREWPSIRQSLANGNHAALNNPYFKSAMHKIGGLDGLEKLIHQSAGTGSSVDLFGNAQQIDADNGDSPDGAIGPFETEIKYLSDPERHALEEMALKHYTKMDTASPDIKYDKSKIPVHQQNTYDNHPKRLGMKEVPKADILGDHPDDGQQTVQYMNLHKKLEELKALLKKAKNG